MELSDAERMLQQQIHGAAWFAFWLAVVLFLLFFLGQRAEDHGPTRLDRWLAAWRAARSVKRSASGDEHYVDVTGRAAPAAAPFPASAPGKMEAGAEAETADGGAEKLLVTREKLDTLLAQARAKGRLEGGAIVLGALLGGGHLDAVKAGDQLTRVKRFAFKYLSAERKPPSGRALTEIINPLSRATEAEAAREREPEPQELRTVGINAGGERQEVVL